MAVVKFTWKWVQQVSAVKKQQDYYDQSFKVRGVSFGLRVYPSGLKRFFIHYKDRGGKKKWFPLDNSPSLPEKEKGVSELTRYKDHAHMLAGYIKKGNDPAAENEAYKRAETVNEIWNQYHNKRTKHQREKTRYERKRIMEREVLPLFGDHKIVDIKRRDIAYLLSDIEESGRQTTARHTRGVLYSVFRYALELEYIEHNPCDGLPRLPKKIMRDRFLNDAEIKKFWEITETERQSIRNLFRLILLTGQRPGEVKGLRWSEIEGDVWILPPERSKNKRRHEIPLSPQAMKIIYEQRDYCLKHLKRAHAKDLEKFELFVFPGHRSGHVKWLKRACDRFVKEGGMKHFVPHDLRRTARTKFSELDIPYDVAEAILNHTMDTLTQTYNRHNYMNQKREALNKWADRIDVIIKSKPAKVFEFKRDQASIECRQAS